MGEIIMMRPSTANRAAGSTPRPDSELLGRFDLHGPRYTSYPTADRMVEAFGAEDLRGWLGRRDLGGRGNALGLYVHLPFCQALCYYCACNKIITRKHSLATEYLDYLEREAKLYRDVLGARVPVDQLHLGGGTPTFLSDDELARLGDMLDTHFDLSMLEERSIEVDPRTVDATRLAALRKLGYDRISFGVQDFEPTVQQAVHRVQPAEQVFALVASARELGFRSINVDLIYGLPKQTPETFERTIAQVRRLRPDRLALYAYAHLPERFKPQRRIAVADLPPAPDKVAMLSTAIERLLDEGYVYVGMDHFALPDDPLAVAKRNGTLHRNFQGYTTHHDGDLIALGVSGIGKIGPTYHQNAKTLPEYYDALERGQLPVIRGIELSRDDLLRRAVIMALMCQGRVDFEAIESAFLVRFRDYFANELERLEEYQALGLVQRDDEGLEVTPVGWFFVRLVAMVFDRHVRQRAAGGASYSRIL